MPTLFLSNVLPVVFLGLDFLINGLIMNIYLVVVNVILIALYFVIMNLGELAMDEPVYAKAKGFDVYPIYWHDFSGKQTS